MENKFVWLAEWNNGQDYEDNETTFIGIYSTQDKAIDKAIEYHNNQLQYTYNPGKASYNVYKVEIDK